MSHCSLGEELILLLIEDFRQAVESIVDLDDEKVNDKINFSGCLLIRLINCAVVKPQLRNELFVFSFL